MVEVWFNAKCSKCRQLRDLLDELGVEYSLRHYLDEPPSEDEILNAASRVDGGLQALVRRKEALYEELGLEEAFDDRLVAALAKHPKLIERPVLFHGNRAIVARPPERGLDLLGD